VINIGAVRTKQTEISSDLQICGRVKLTTTIPAALYFEAKKRGVPFSLCLARGIRLACRSEAQNKEEVQELQKKIRRMSILINELCVRISVLEDGDESRTNLPPRQRSGR